MTKTRTLFAFSRNKRKGKKTLTLVLNVASLTSEIYSQLNKYNRHRYQNLDDRPYVTLVYLCGKSNDHKYCIRSELADHVSTFYDVSSYEHC